MQPKTKTYHVNSTTDNSHLDSLLPASICTNDNNGLSDEENNILKAIGSTKSKGIYAGIIRQRCQEIIETGDAILYTELIDTLVSQMNDCEATMLKILGENGLSALRKVSIHSRMVKASKRFFSLIEPIAVSLTPCISILGLFKTQISSLK